MKRQDFYRIITESCKGEKPFEMIYKKKNGEIRKAKCKLHDAVADLGVKGTGMNRETKMKEKNVFQYYDIKSEAYRSAKLENILSVKIGEDFEEVVD